MSLNISGAGLFLGGVSRSALDAHSSLVPTESDIRDDDTNDDGEEEGGEDGDTVRFISKLGFSVSSRSGGCGFCRPDFLFIHLLRLNSVAR